MPIDIKNDTVIKKTKDFMWEYMDEPTKSFLAEMATTDILTRFGLYVDKVHGAMDGVKKNGIILEEKVSISVQYT